MCSIFIITDYNFRFIVRNGSGGWHLLIPQYGYLTSTTYFSDNLGTSLYLCSLSNFTSTSCTCYRVVQHSHYHVSLYIVLFPILGMLMKCGLLSRQIVDTVCTYHLFLMVIILLSNILFVIADLVLRYYFTLNFCSQICYYYYYL